MTVADRSPLKDLLDLDRFRALARQFGAIWPAFDAAAFPDARLAGLDALSLTQRLRRLLRPAGPARQRAAGFRARGGGFAGGGAPHRARFVAMLVPDYIGQYGQDHFALPIAALANFTGLGSSECAVRAFLRRDPCRTLNVMKAWAGDARESVGRLASEGSRPRLPWSFRLDAIAADPPILARLRADPSPYVRKSVVNHLNDVSKAHPRWLLRS